MASDLIFNGEPFVIEPGLLSIVRFIAYGTPMAKGSGSKTKVGVYIEDGTPDRRLEDGTKRIGTRTIKKQWAQTVQRAASGLVGEPLDGPLYIGARFYFQRPRSRRKLRETYHTIKPDVDKCLRALFDPLKLAGLIADDCRIAKIFFVEKLYTDDHNPRAEVMLGKLWHAP